MSKCSRPSSYLRKVVENKLEKRATQRQAVGSHRLILQCGHTVYRQGTLRVPKRTRCEVCWKADNSPEVC